MKKTKTLPIDVNEEMLARIDAVVSSIGMSRNGFMRAAIEAGVKAFESSGGKIVLPIEFNVTNLPITDEEVRKWNAAVKESVPVDEPGQTIPANRLADSQQPSQSPDHAPRRTSSRVRQRIPSES